ncbi:alpha-N-arabinofuranosidase [Alkalihalobacillus xiaoxiensis]|uniref:Alpha-N-arabinofuranosidase n=1 Tax=Shouchella xiaoxiensis TaxID=766895 RepID=A0ABS2STZ7_9BACI|nr:glycoside hydrolase family 43 protein [Shouchella xiaoxiensis]MBM7838949.1 alpha-N-arabinofuranosidase [Shouchella xiaoxiensis]
MAEFKNPIIPGFYPDPSVCRVGEDYYLVVSSFEYFPGVPLFHSKDLVNWKQIGHVLDRVSQLQLDGTPNSRGIYAPTIRYHNGLFYLITTFVVSQTGARKNFYVTATDPAGAWSDPIWLKDAPGIDPSLFFDDDGKVYYTGNRVPEAGQTHAKHMEIWLQELDVKSGLLIGDKTGIWDGALKVAHAQEAPHIYKKDDWYYLIIAEGGTGFTHAVTVARSRKIDGPYESNKRNPILTHRHLNKNYPIANVGHGDLVQTQTGEWWMVCLGSRPYGGIFRNMGRETFLAPVEWEDEWPVVCGETGKLELKMEGPTLTRGEEIELDQFEDFNEPTLNLAWNMIRTPQDSFFSLTEKESCIRLYGKPHQLSECENPSFIGRRQQHLSFRATTKFTLQSSIDGDQAGMALFYSQDNHFRFEIVNDKERRLRLVRLENGEETILAEKLVELEEVELRIRADLQELSFFYKKAGNWKKLMDQIDARLLSTDRAGGFVGTYIGLFCISKGAFGSTKADFDWFEYKGETYD